MNVFPLRDRHSRPAVAAFALALDQCFRGAVEADHQHAVRRDRGEEKRKAPSYVSFRAAKTARNPRKLGIPRSARNDTRRAYRIF